MDEDVFQLIAYQLYYGTTGALTQLAFTSRRLRCLCMPTLFSNCGAYYSGQQGLPPITIRTFVRYVLISFTLYSPFHADQIYLCSHLTYYGECDQRHCEDVFGKELACLPALRRITFAGPNFGVPWPVLKRCLVVPNLIGIQFSAPARFAYVTPYPNEEIAGLQLALKSLSYTPYPWRLMTDSLAYLPSLPPYYVGPEVETALEDRCLPPLVCKMHLTAEYLKLPAETAPLARMCNTPWPSLRELHLCGRLPDDIELPLLRRLIPQLPQIHTLMLEVCQSKAKTDRLSVLGRASYAPDRPLTLQTLSIAYPDPQDSIIAAVSGTHLTSLSLCDYPRFYIHRTSSMIHWRWNAPILSSSDCLVMLRRMRLPHLRSLELVYETDGSDDELLQHVATAFSGLSHLALHRYRQDRTQSVLYVSPVVSFR